MFLKLQELSITYPGQSTPAVDSVTLGMSEGQIGVLLGPSGCGKTTLLRAIAGLEPIGAGRITLARQPVGGSGQGRRVGMVFQEYALFPHMTVAQNVAYGLQDWPRAQRQSRVDEVLTLVDLQAWSERYPHALSGGQQQRVALARALAPRPDLLLLDEPFSNLDIELRERLAHDVRQILKTAGITALMVTHDQQEAFAMGDVMGVMRDGVLHQWDAPYAVYHRPATRFVADFIGQGVLMPAKIVQRDGHVYVETPLGALTDMAECPLPQSYPGGECDLLLRADDVQHDDAARFQGRVLRKAFRGADFLYTLELADGLQVLAQVPSHHDHAIGELIGLRLEIDHVVTFPREPATQAS
ncbi:MAG: ABC transporter ATP-binding protein [Limnohabitans sp.]